MKRTTRHPRRKERQDNAKTLQMSYNSLTLDEKIKRQEPFQGKQYRKLLAQKEKKA